jgi:hypothetical protein
MVRKQRSAWWVLLGAIAGGVIGFLIGWVIASDEIGKLGDWRHGALRFLGMCGAIGLFLGAGIASRFARGAPVTRDGFTLSYKRIEPTAAGYRELTTLTIATLLDALREVGYEPSATACDDTGSARAPIDLTTALAGSNFAIRDPKVRGWIRVQLAVPPEGQGRAMGLIEMWSERGDSTEELALFTLRVLDTLVGDLRASRESSVLSEDPAAMVTAGLDDKPRHRR